MGRRKVEMKKITNSSSRLVTFSKRRTGLFKKANEISTLCAIEVAIIVFSPGGKPFSFGKPNVEKVVRRFRNKHQQHLNGFTPLDSKADKARVQKLSQELTNLDAQIELENKRSWTLEQEAHQRKLGAKNTIEDLDSNQLIELRKKMQALSEGSTQYVKELEASDSLLLLASGGSPK